MNEGGFSHDVFKHLFGDKIINSDLVTTYGGFENYQGSFKGFLEKYNGSGLMNINSINGLDLHRYSPDELNKLFPGKNSEQINKIKEGSQRGDFYKVSAIDLNGKKVNLHMSHAYSIGEVNLSKGYVEIINPHDTVNKKFLMKISDLEKYFNAISFVEL